ncbi:transcriptional repressor scratch 1-like [Centruroides vittatus]|uniref:transcriptional repressor scratch 1-like n=1 Tax=Centruroides vittatus TaxID=120091 RepID=UPI0035106FC6
MPRAFLITNRRYDADFDYRRSHVPTENSPERSVRTAEDPTDGEASDPRPARPDGPGSPADTTRAPSPGRCPPQPGPPGARALDFRARRWARGQAAALHRTVLAAVVRRMAGEERAAPPREAHACPECGKRYSTSSNLARHRQTHRSVTDKKARKCPHCDKVYVSVPAYSMHVRTHGRGCQCPYCGKCFSRPWLLQGHVRTHTGEKPFGCPVCNKAFADKSNLRAHIQTHSSSKPFVCQRCGKAFALKSYLYKHEESSCMRLHRRQADPRA